MGKNLGFERSGENENDKNEIREEPIILPFDGGGGITAPDLTHHVIIFGATGSGKTTNCLLPAVHRLIEEGHCVIVLAVKDSLSDYVQALARSCGREGDVRLRGTTPGSQRMNLLAGKTDSEIYEIFDDMAFTMIRGMSHNYDFHVKGFSQAVDCCFLLRKVGRVLPGVAVAPHIVSEMIHDSYGATTLWKFYRDFIYDPSDKEEARFRKAIESNPFHIFNEPQTEEERKKTPPSRYEQMNYQMGQIRTTLRNFVEVPGIIKYFSDPDGAGLDMNPTITENLIDIIQFDPECGPAAASLGRVLLSHIYKAIIRHGKKIPRGRKICVVIDEFQSVADLSPKRYSDSSFASIAREFNGVLVAATQSMAALASRGDNMGEVESLVSNCNANIFFYTSDAYTQNKARQHDDGIILSDLKPGEAFVAHYNNDTREHKAGIKTFQEAYESTKALLESVSTPEPDDGPAPDTLSLADILDLAEARKSALAREKERKRTETIMEGKKKKPVITVEFRSDNEKKKGRGSSDELMKENRKEIQWFNEVKFGDIDEGESGDSSGSKTRRPVANVGDQAEERPDLLIAMFPEFFADGATIEIPNGWRSAVERIMLMFSKLGMSTKILALYPRDGHLFAECRFDRLERQRRSGESILNSLLKYTGDFCMLCGDALAREEREFGDEVVSLCGRCRKEYGLESGREKEEGQGAE